VIDSVRRPRIVAILAVLLGLLLMLRCVPGLVDPDLAAVRAYLKENSPTGKWEELKWWPGREEDWGPSGKAGPRPRINFRCRICRLKYREGGCRVIDQIFIIRDGKAETLGLGLAEISEALGSGYVWRQYYGQKD
jgi:hypothetical protein